MSKEKTVVAVFKTQYTPHERVHCSSGSPMKILYGLQYEEDGSAKVVEKGKENLYLYIQSSADSVDINNLVARYKAGENDVLDKVKGSFGDFTQLPKTYAEMLNLRIKAEDVFLGLPVEVRAKFGFDLNKFMCQAGSPEWLAAFEKPVQKNAQVDKGAEKPNNVNESSSAL